MILYALACDKGHSFESWFRDSQAFEEQVAIGRVACPICRSAQVAKAIMSPAVVGARGLAAASADAPDGAARPSEMTGNVALLDTRSLELRALIRKTRDRLMAEGHDVGRQFATEARRIHEGTTPARQIYGQASVAEARDLLEDGIMVLPLPIVPEELN